MSNIACDPSIGDHHKKILAGEFGDGGWMLLGYEGKTNVVLKETGKDGISGLLSKLVDEEVQYGFVSVDMNPGFKYVFLTYVGPLVNPMLRAKVSVHKGAVKNSCPGFTVEYQANNREDLDPVMIARKTVIPITKVITVW